MTGVPLGLRSGTHGSLQQQSQSGPILPIQSPAVVPRRPARSFSGSKEKERILATICKFVGRRKLWMLFLLMTSVAVLSFTSILSKEEDVFEGPNARMDSTRQIWEVVSTGGPSLNSSSPQVILADENRSDATLRSNQEFASLNSFSPPVIVVKRNKVDIISKANQELLSHNINQISVPIIPPMLHPCENFPLPSPPADKRHTGPRPCPVCYVPVEQALLFMPHSPSRSPVLEKLSYFSEDNFISNESNEGSTFGGHPSLLQRNKYFDIKESMTVHCGFANGMKPGQGTGFDIDESFLSEMEECNDVVVASAIFGNYDVIQQPKNISEYAKKNACFYMFIDEGTEAYMKNSSALDETQRIGLWRVVVVRNLPYADSRRNGKVPKLLLHRLFPNVRFSLWIDGKLELVVDPYQVLERFLWRRKHTFAISRHYKRFDVFEEAEANKAAGKYDNASIDYQIEFYKKEGLTPYSSTKLPITSDVPEGCVIIKEHIPITNLFTCLWFNEVDRFTSRDQISFSTVRDKIMSQVNWTINMFEDCERRNFVVQAYHRDLLEQRNALAEKLKALARIRPPPATAAVTKGRFRIAEPPPLRKLPPAKVSRKERRTRRRHPRAAMGL